MCSPARCPQCGKTTWRGCGQHVDAVMSSVRPQDRCQCERAEPTSMLRRLFSR